MSFIVKGMGMPKGGLYNVMNGKFFKYKAKGGTVRQYDIIEIVECKDCKYWHEGISYDTCDKHIGHGFPSNYFCADGERREE